MSLTVKDALELYENGKHRRYSLLFSVNGGAFAIAKILADKGRRLVVQNRGGGDQVKHSTFVTTRNSNA